MKTTVAQKFADSRNNFSPFLFWTYTLLYWNKVFKQVQRFWTALNPFSKYQALCSQHWKVVDLCILCLMLCALWCTFNTAKKHNSDQWEKCCMCCMAKHPISNLTPVWESSWLMYFKVSTLCEQNIHVLHHLNILWSYNLIHSTHQHSVFIQFDDLHHTNIF